MMIKQIQKLRQEGLLRFFTIDVGLNVHCLCQSKNLLELESVINRINEVKKTIWIQPADDAYLTTDYLF